MDVSIINRILNSFTDIMPQLGFTNIKIGEVVLRGKCIESPGVIVIIGIIGDIQGNIIYSMDGENAKKIASVMMMGSEIKEFDNIAQSAVSELINMLTAKAVTNLSDRGIVADISTPTLIYGKFITNANKEKVVNVVLEINGVNIEVNMALEIIKENY